jgi:septation ring formation regulator EzrA
MTEAQSKTTPDDIRARVEEIAVEAYVDTSDPTEPLDELIQRVRVGIQDEREQMSSLYEDLEAELNGFAKALAQHESPTEPSS